MDKAVIDLASGTGDTTIVAAPGSGKKIEVFKFLVSSGGTSTAYWKTGSDTHYGGSNKGSNANATVDFRDESPSPIEFGPLFSGGDNEALVLTRGSAATFSGQVWYRVRDA